MRHEERDIENPLFHSPLTPSGIRNAELVVDTLSTTLNIQVVYTSPFLRAVQTIIPFCASEGMFARVEQALYESMDSPVFNAENSNCTWRDLPQEYYQWIDTEYASIVQRVPLCETFSDVCNRVKPFLQSLRTYDKDEKNVLLVTHMTTAKAMQSVVGVESKNLRMGEIMSLDISSLFHEI